MKSVFKGVLLVLIGLVVVMPLADAVERTSDTIQGTSLLGKPLIAAPEQEAALAKYKEAKKRYAANPMDADTIIWYGRRAAYLTRYLQAIDIFSEGVKKFPEDARMYRHRGHRYISIREFDKAIVDLEKARSLIKGKEDEIEPDGMPNALNIPVSTLHSNIRYHLGLAYYLKGEFEQAVRAYEEDLASVPNDDMLVATTHWLYMSLRRLGKDEQAKRVIEAIKPDMNVIENQAYHRLGLFYKGVLAEEQLVKDDTVGYMNVGAVYGLANWHYYHGRKKQARKLYEQILNDVMWAGFGYIAAEADYARHFSVK